MGAHNDDTTLTLQVPRKALAFAVAVVGHVVVVVLVAQLPEPKPEPQRISITVQRPPPPPSPPAVRPPPKGAPARRASPTTAPPQTSPVVPVLPPSEQPPDNRAVLPVVEEAPTPAPTPSPAAWKDRLLASLAANAPKAPVGALAPSLSTLERVAFDDARLHDDENEARLQTDYGPFFRRGIEALRGHWHPDDALRADRFASVKRCSNKTRTTFAIAVINRSGDVIDVELRNPSGCPELDEEAVAAFRRVAMFPNPPEGLFVNPNGTPAATARYPVRFVVSFDGRLRLDWG